MKKGGWGEEEKEKKKKRINQVLEFKVQTRIVRPGQPQVCGNQGGDCHHHGHDEKKHSLVRPVKSKVICTHMKLQSIVTPATCNCGNKETTSS